MGWRLACSHLTSKPSWHPVECLFSTRLLDLTSLRFLRRTHGIHLRMLNLNRSSFNGLDWYLVADRLEETPLFMGSFTGRLGCQEDVLSKVHRLSRVKARLY